MEKPNVEETAEAIDAIAKRMIRCAAELEQAAERMRSSGDLAIAGDAMISVANLYPNLRLDLLVIRPLRAVGVA